ncbi:MAG: NADPH-dependent FMN reductase [Bacilli bacterium]
MRIGIIGGSTRQGTIGKGLGDWILSLSQNRKANYELIDLATFNLPLLGEKDRGEGAKRWIETVKNLDGFVFLTAEYNHSITASLKNALDYPFAEWSNKAAGIISYGYAGGARAAEHLRTILGALNVADVQQHVLLNLNTEFEAKVGFKPAPHQSGLIQKLFDQVEAWAGALKTLRN